MQQSVEEVKKNGIAPENIYLMGFSQGACLALEFVARRSQSFGGIAAFTGDLKSDRIYTDNYSGNFKATATFIGTGNPDPNVFLERVNYRGNS